MNSTIKFSVNFTVPRIETIVADHFKMFFRYMLNQPFNKGNGGNGLDDIFIIFMTVVVKGNQITVIRINAGSSDNRSAKVTTDVITGSTP